MANPDCKSKLVTYAFCLGNNFTSDAGVTCDEDFVGVGVSQTALTSRTVRFGTRANPNAPPNDQAICASPTADA